MAAPDVAATSQLQIRKPRYLNPLSGQSFRDLALHERYACAVTPSGDLLQWGSGYSSDLAPSLSLRGQNIVQVALTPNKIYARSKSGKVYIVPASKADQTDTSKKPLPTISFFWKIFGYKDPGAHFVEMTIANQERKNKKVIDISAGRSHLLALGEDGRAMVAACDVDANDCGQLGGGKLLVDAVSSKADGEGIVADSDISYDTTLKDIPALRKLSMRQLVAGDRHSLGLTSEGRVLAWGNNSLGQLGLGGGYAFPTIPAPTEANLGASYPKSARIAVQKLFAGGDQSYFLVSREDIKPSAGADYTDSGDKRVYEDLLAAGNGMYGGKSALRPSWTRLTCSCRHGQWRMEQQRASSPRQDRLWPARVQRSKTDHSADTDTLTVDSFDAHRCGALECSTGRRLEASFR